MVLPVFFLAPEAGALAEVVECAVVEPVAGGESEEPERILAGLLPDACAAQLAAIGLGIDIFHELFPFLVARDVPTFRCDALEVLVLHLFVHREILGRGFVGEFCGNVQRGSPCVEASELFNVGFLVVRCETAFRLETQVLGHPDLVADFDGVVGLSVTGVGECPVLERFLVLFQAFFVGDFVLGLGGGLLGRLGDMDAHAVCSDSYDDDGEDDECNERYVHMESFFGGFL